MEVFFEVLKLKINVFFRRYLGKGWGLTKMRKKAKKLKMKGCGAYLLIAGLY